jgi:hypothetical protein
LGSPHKILQVSDAIRLKPYSYRMNKSMKTVTNRLHSEMSGPEIQALELVGGTI